jgi:uncharacterized protein (DUF488 family)
VKVLVDTRAVASSQRAAFSKSLLAAFLAELGITYIHLRKLGTPADGRAAARSGDVKTLWRIYNKHLQTPEATEAMEELVSLVGSTGPVCLLCYEREPDHCHRSRIAEILHERTGIAVENLVAPLF